MPKYNALDPVDMIDEPDHRPKDSLGEVIGLLANVHPPRDPVSAMLFGNAFDMLIRMWKAERSR
jgi:hypothetical protein